MSQESNDIKKVAYKLKKNKEHKIKKEKGFLSSGSTLLNLACSNSPFGAFPKGKYVFFVGDSTSGKTFLAMTCLAESLRSSEFENYRLIYDNVEDGCLIDLEKLFNKKVAKKVEPPAVDENGDPIYSFKVEEFYYNLDDAIAHAKANNQPFIYILDSMDSLSSTFEEDKFEEHKNAHRKGKSSAGSYGDGKAKKNSEGIRQVLRGLRETDSILIIICQTRDNIGSMFGGKTRSGGHALRFYSTIEIWTSLQGRLKKSIKGKERIIGITAQAEIKKNRITGQLHKVDINIYPSYGIDDIGGCIDYLVNEQWWKGGKKGSKIEAEELGVSFTRDKLISYIEENKLYRKLQIIVGRCWNEIQEASKLSRKKRYEEENDVDSN